MRIHESNKKILEKVVNTLEVMDEYRKQLKKFVDRIKFASGSRKSARPPSRLLTHFTGGPEAKRIITTGELKINAEQYVSFTELNPFEFHTITQKKTRRLGFGFFKKELMDQDLDLFVPMSFAKPDKHVTLRNSLQGDEYKKYFVKESSSGQPSILFSNLLEVRSAQNVPLELCRLFFRDEALNDPKYEKALSDYGIFQLPRSVLWYSSYFLKDQKWVYKEESDCVVIHDNRSRSYVGEQTISSAELIDQIKKKLLSSPCAHRRI